MALLTRKPSKYAFFTEGDSLTEQEHKDTCDINKMIKKISLGQEVPGKKLAPWGEQYTDDTTMDGLRFRIEKEQLEKSLNQIAATEELDEAAMEHIPKSIQEKFKFKTRKNPKNPQINDDDKKLRTNDDDKTQTPSPT